jgi:hypothetical protein
LKASDRLTFESKLSTVSGITRRFAPRDPFCVHLKAINRFQMKKPALFPEPVYGFGVEDGIRTHDTWNHNPVL